VHDYIIAFFFNFKLLTIVVTAVVMLLFVNLTMLLKLIIVIFIKFFFGVTIFILTIFLPRLEDLLIELPYYLPFIKLFFVIIRLGLLLFIIFISVFDVFIIIIVILIFFHFISFTVAFFIVTATFLELIMLL
jgi:hypothetical protein